MMLWTSYYLLTGYAIQKLSLELMQESFVRIQLDLIHHYLLFSTCHRDENSFYYLSYFEILMIFIFIIFILNWQFPNFYNSLYSMTKLDALIFSPSLKRSIIFNFSNTLFLFFFFNTNLYVSNSTRRENKLVCIWGKNMCFKI